MTLSIYAYLMSPILVVGGGTCVYALILRRIADLAQPLRLQLAREGEWLLGNPWSREDEQVIRFMLDNAFNPLPMVVASIGLPIAIAVALVKAIAGKDQLPKTTNRELRNRQVKVSGLFALSSFAANPVFGLIVLCEVLILGSILVLLVSYRALVLAILNVLMVEAKTIRPARSAA
jgi:hypothetical protein